MIKSGELSFTVTGTFTFLSLLFVCMYMCACVYTYVGKHVYVFSSVWKPGLVCYPWRCSSCILIQGFWFLNRFLGSPVWLGWLAREPQESSCFHLPSISMTSTWRHTQLFCMDARDQTQACMSENFLAETSPQPQLWTIVSLLCCNTGADSTYKRILMLDTLLLFLPSFPLPNFYWLLAYSL